VNPAPGYIDVSGLLEGHEDLLAIEFVDWRQWLSMRVFPGDGMADASPQTVLAAVLSEMTFAGYSNMQATELRHIGKLRHRSVPRRRQCEDICEMGNEGLHIGAAPPALRPESRQPPAARQPLILSSSAVACADPAYFSAKESRSDRNRFLISSAW
jgi:hypothetical protein